MKLLKTIGGYSAVTPPLPIPNREVKHSCANGTEKSGEQVTAQYSLRPKKRINDVKLK